MRHELLIVEDCFQVTGRGLILVPDFLVPEKWKNMSTEALVIRPDGTEMETTAKLILTHFNFNGTGKHPFRIVVSLPHLEKDTVPIGSRIMIAQAVKEKLSAKAS